MNYTEAIARWLTQPTTNGDIISIMMGCIFLWGLYWTIDVITFLIVKWRIRK